MSPWEWAEWPIADWFAGSIYPRIEVRVYLHWLVVPYLQRRALKRSDRLVANSRKPERLHSKYKDQMRPDAQVIYNSCIRNFHRRRTNQLREETHGLVCASMFRPEKKQKDFSKSAASRNLDWKLTLAGDGSERNACIQLASQLGIDDRVEFPGLLEDPTNLYQKSHIAIHAPERIPPTLSLSQIVCRL